MSFTKTRSFQTTRLMHQTFVTPFFLFCIRITYQPITKRHGSKKSAYVCRFDYLKEIIARISFYPVDLCGCIEESKSLMFGKSNDTGLVKAFLVLYLKIALVTKMYQSHYSPEVVCIVRIEEIHAPSSFGRRKTSQEQHTCIFRKEGGERMRFDNHLWVIDN